MDLLWLHVVLIICSSCRQRQDGGSADDVWVPRPLVVLPVVTGYWLVDAGGHASHVPNLPGL